MNVYIYNHIYIYLLYISVINPLPNIKRPPFPNNKT